MNKQDAIDLLRSGREGVGEWNRRQALSVGTSKRPGLPVCNDLSGADFSNCDLTWAWMPGINFSGANFDGAMLNGVNFCVANLNHASLVNASIQSVNLSVSSLAHTDFTGASLTDTDFTRARFSGTNLTNATCAYTTFSYVDLRQVVGLETIDHTHPSDVGINTLYLSAGDVPDIFLRGCGVPDQFLTFKKSLTSSAIEYYSCFISYSHEDKEFARRLHDSLQGRGIRCWLDEKQILPGDDIYELVDEGIRLWDKVLLCASQASLTSWWVDNEVDKAFKKEQSLMKKRKKKILSLIPLNLDGFIFDDKFQRGWKDQLHTRFAADFRTWKTDHDSFESQLALLVRALRADGGGRDPIPPQNL